MTDSKVITIGHSQDDKGLRAGEMDRLTKRTSTDSFHMISAAEATPSTPPADTRTSEEKQDDFAKKAKEKHKAQLAKWTYLEPEDIKELHAIMKRMQVRMKAAWMKQAESDWSGLTRRSASTEHIVGKMRASYLELFQNMYHSARSSGLGDHSFFYPEMLIRTQRLLGPGTWKIRPWHHNPNGWQLYLRQAGGNRQICAKINFDEGKFYLEQCHPSCLKAHKEHPLHKSCHVPLQAEDILAHFDEDRMRPIIASSIAAQSTPIAARYQDYDEKSGYGDDDDDDDY